MNSLIFEKEFKFRQEMNSSLDGKKFVFWDAKIESSLGFGKTVKSSSVATSLWLLNFRIGNARFKKTSLIQEEQKKWRYFIFSRI